MGYSLNSKQCKVRKGYFLKSPSDINITKIPIIIKDDYTNFVTNFPMTLYIKFLGNKLEKVVSGKNIKRKSY